MKWLLGCALSIAVLASTVVYSDFKTTFLIERNKYSTLDWLSDESSNHWRYREVKC